MHLNMADENAGQTNSEDSQKGDKKSIIISILVGLLILIIGAVILSGSSEEKMETGATSTSKPNPITKIINIIRPKPKATPTPSVTETISGTITLTGDVPDGSSLAVAIKSQTNPNYQPAVGELKLGEKVDWSYNKAVKGNTYYIQAYLLDNQGVLISQSQVETIVAPATGLGLSINYSSDLAKPPFNSLRVDCEKKDEKTGNWQVKITYNINNPTSSAKQYRLGIGTSRSGDLVLDSIIKPKSPDVAQTYLTDFIVKEGLTYFAAYSYATCDNCNNFSPTSNWEEFVCKSPTPSPSPTAASISN